MPPLSHAAPSRRPRLPRSPDWAGLLLGLAGLAVVGLESSSFGHDHLKGGQAAHHHHHFFSGAHEHGPAAGHDPADDHEAPAEPHQDHGPERTVTFATAAWPVLPAAVQTLLPPLTRTLPALSPRNPEVGAGPVLAPASPRGPPSPALALHSVP